MSARASGMALSAIFLPRKNEIATQWRTDGDAKKALSHYETGHIGARYRPNHKPKEPISDAETGHIATRRKQYESQLSMYQQFTKTS